MFPCLAERKLAVLKKETFCALALMNTKYKHPTIFTFVFQRLNRKEGNDWKTESNSSAIINCRLDNLYILKQKWKQWILNSTGISMTHTLPSLPSVLGETGAQPGWEAQAPLNLTVVHTLSLWAEFAWQHGRDLPFVSSTAGTLKSGYLLVFS